MANRSYLYARDAGEPPRWRDLSEWNTNVPLSHLLLLSGHPRLVDSALWKVEHPIAIEADFAPGWSALRRFLDYLRTQPLPESDTLNKHIDDTVAFFSRSDNQRQLFHLEGGEIYDLISDAEPLEKQAAWTLDDISSVAAEAARLADSGAPINSAQTFVIGEVAKDWRRWLGLYWANILYFHFSEPEASPPPPPVDTPPAEPADVEPAELLANPGAFDGMVVRSLGMWRRAHDGTSTFLRAKLTPTAEYQGRGPASRYMLISGEWRAPQTQPPLPPTLRAHTMSEVAPRRRTVNAETLRADWDQLQETAVGRFGYLVWGPGLAAFDGFPIVAGLAHAPFIDPAVHTPQSSPVNAVFIPVGNGLELVDCDPLSDASPVEPAAVALDELAQHPYEFVEVSGVLHPGDYWPRLGDIEVVVPGCTGTADAFGRVSPMPGPLQSWTQELASHPEGKQVVVRGSLQHGKLHAYAIA